MLIDRNLQSLVCRSLENNPVTAIIGPRQSGKSTLAKSILGSLEQSIHLDLERPRDLAKLTDPELFFSSHKAKTICLDEIQRKPEIFPLIRSLVDEWGGNGHFLILGSASIQLLRQSSESLAGRIAYNKLYPFVFDEVKEHGSLQDFLVRGGYPRSFLAESQEASSEWLHNLIQTYIERDLLQWSGVSSTTMLRIWTMLAHLNGQVANYSQLSNSLGVSSNSVKNYCELLANTFMIHMIPPFLPNIGKRLVKSPKIYLADHGVLLSLLGIETYDELLGHPIFGYHWESVVLSQIMALFPRANISHYRTSHGNEIDFVVEIRGEVIAIECKASTNPSLTKGNYSAIADLKAKHNLVVSPVNESWPIANNISICSLSNLKNEIIGRLKNP